MSPSIGMYNVLECLSSFSGSDPSACLREGDDQRCSALSCTLYLRICSPFFRIGPIPDSELAIVSAFACRENE